MAKAEDAGNAVDVSGMAAAGGEGGGSGSEGLNIGNLAVKALVILGGAYVIKRITKRTTRWDHARSVAQHLSGEKFSADQAARDPMTYFNLRLDACPVATLPDDTKVLYYEQAFWRTPERPFRQRFYTVKPCAKEQKCEVEVASYAVKDVEQYKNYCSRKPKDSSAAEEVKQDMGEHLSTVFLSRCERGKRCLFEGSTPPGGYPNNWNGATRCTSEMTIFRSGEVHTWDRAWDDNDKQVWGPKGGPYEFKPKNLTASSGPFSDADR